MDITFSLTNFNINICTVIFTYVHKDVTMQKGVFQKVKSLFDDHHLEKTRLFFAKIALMEYAMNLIVKCIAFKYIVYIR